jgi:hypothetical protein
MVNLSELKEGDNLRCIRWSNHFSTGDIYRVHRLTTDILCIWCDDIQPHWVKSLDPTQFEKVVD